MHDAVRYDISYTCVFYNMAKIKNKAVHQTNKNNKTKPKNLMKKEYLESYEELKKDQSRSTNMRKNINSTVRKYFRILVK